MDKRLVIQNEIDQILEKAKANSPFQLIGKVLNILIITEATYRPVENQYVSIQNLIVNKSKIQETYIPTGLELHLNGFRNSNSEILKTFLKYDFEKEKWLLMDEKKKSSLYGYESSPRDVEFSLYFEHSIEPLS